MLELVPSFARSSEIYLRLGVIFKKNGDYCNSMENFKKALTIPGPSSFNKLESKTGGKNLEGKKKIMATRMGFEPTRAEHNGLAVHRLNHSATSSDYVFCSDNVFINCFSLTHLFLLLLLLFSLFFSFFFFLPFFLPFLYSSISYRTSALLARISSYCKEDL